jgi:hypothetical protein
MNHKKVEVNKNGLITGITHPESDCQRRDDPVLIIILILILPVFALIAFCFREIVRAVKIKGFEGNFVISQKTSLSSRSLERTNSKFKNIDRQTSNFIDSFFKNSATPLSLADFETYAERLKNSTPVYGCDYLFYYKQGYDDLNPKLSKRIDTRNYGNNNYKLYTNPTAAFEHEQTHATIEKDQFQRSIKDHLSRKDHLDKYRLTINCPYRLGLEPLNFHKEEFQTYIKEAHCEADRMKESLKTRPESKGRAILIALIDKLYTEFDNRIKKTLNTINHRRQSILESRISVRTGFEGRNFLAGNLEKKIDSLFHFLKNYTLDEIKTMFGPSEKLKGKGSVTSEFDVVGTLIDEDEGVKVVPYANIDK